MTYASSGYLITDKRGPGSSALNNEVIATGLDVSVSSPTNTQIDVILYQDTSMDGSADNQEEFTDIADGESVLQLSNFTADDTFEFWARFDISTTDSATTPDVDSAEVNLSVPIPEDPTNLTLTLV